jgi:hypothetical protein
MLALGKPPAVFEPRQVSALEEGHPYWGFTEVPYDDEDGVFSSHKGPRNKSSASCRIIWRIFRVIVVRLYVS